MTLDEFSLKLHQAVKPGIVFVNPGGGTSEVISVSSSKISYRRKSSTMTIRIESLYDAFSAFRNSRMSSPDLRALWIHEFDGMTELSNLSRPVLRGGTGYNTDETGFSLSEE